MTKPSRFMKTRDIYDAMNNTDVSFADIERLTFLDLYEDELLVPMEAAFEALDGQFEGAYSAGAESWWENTAQHAREVLERIGMLGEEPNDVSHQYAMHYGIPYRDLSQPEIDAVSRAVVRFGGTAYCRGDNFMEWGEHRAQNAEEAYPIEQVGEVDHIANQSGHLVVFINKGHLPEVVHSYVEEALPLVRFLPIESRYAYNGSKPFVVDEAECWGENVHIAWHVSAVNSNHGQILNFGGLPR